MSATQTPRRVAVAGEGLAALATAWWLLRDETRRPERVDVYLPGWRPRTLPAAPWPGGWRHLHALTQSLQEDGHLGASVVGQQRSRVELHTRFRGVEICWRVHRPRRTGRLVERDADGLANSPGSLTTSGLEALDTLEQIVWRVMPEMPPWNGWVDALASRPRHEARRAAAAAALAMLRPFVEEVAGRGPDTRHAIGRAALTRALEQIRGRLRPLLTPVADSIWEAHAGMLALEVGITTVVGILRQGADRGGLGKLDKITLASFLRQHGALTEAVSSPALASLLGHTVHASERRPLAPDAVAAGVGVRALLDLVATYDGACYVAPVDGGDALLAALIAGIEARGGRLAWLHRADVVEFADTGAPQLALDVLGRARGGGYAYPARAAAGSPGPPWFAEAPDPDALIGPPPGAADVRAGRSVVRRRVLRVGRDVDALVLALEADGAARVLRESGDRGLEWARVLDALDPGASAGEARRRALLPAAVTARLQADGTGCAGLFVAGDLADAGTRAASPESDAIGALRASRAICGYPPRDPVGGDGL